VGRVSKNISLDEETLKYLLSRMVEKKKLHGLGDVIREIVEENNALREQVEKLKAELC
jgi:CII-binding regulator of phage lambda lysogenization HflD